MSEKSYQEICSELESARRKVQFLQGNLDRIMEIGCSIIYILDAGGRFTFVNHAVEEILHYTPEELIGRHFSCILSPEEFDRIGRDRVLPRFSGKATGPDATPKLFDERRRGPRRTRNIEVCLLTREGREVKILRGDVTGIMSSEGYYAAGSGEPKPVFLGSQGIIFDITTLKRSEDQKKQIESRFSELQKFDAIGRLAGGAAHNFNNKLGAILGYAEMLRSRFGGQNPELVRYVELIIAATKQSADLTSQLLAFSRQGTYQRVLINLNKVMLKVCRLFTSTMLRRIRIIHDFDTHNPVALGDPTQVQNAILNVVMNAVDAMPQGGDLTIATKIAVPEAGAIEEHGLSADTVRYVQVSVSDTGMGMTDEVKSRIFEPFFTTKEVGKGVGMGLAAVYGCVRNHHGFIEVDSSEGSGTRISLYFPYAGEEGFTDSASAAAEGDPLHGNGLILVVEDDVDLATIIHEMLVDLGYMVVVCKNGTEAVDYYRDHNSEVACTVIDLVLPLSEGADCYHRMRQINADVRVVVTTGYSTNEDIDALLNDGICDFVTKPFDINRLSQAVYRAINIKNE